MSGAAGHSGTRIFTSIQPTRSERVAIREQSRIGGDSGAAKLQCEAAVKIEPQDAPFYEILAIAGNMVRAISVLLLPPLKGSPARPVGLPHYRARE